MKSRDKSLTFQSNKSKNIVFRYYNQTKIVSFVLLPTNLMVQVVDQTGIQSLDVKYIKNIVFNLSNGKECDRGYPKERVSLCQTKDRCPTNLLTQVDSTPIHSNPYPSKIHLLTSQETRKKGPHLRPLSSLLEVFRPHPESSCRDGTDIYNTVPYLWFGRFTAPRLDLFNHLP